MSRNEIRTKLRQYAGLINKMLMEDLDNKDVNWELYFMNAVNTYLFWREKFIRIKPRQLSE